MLTLSSLQEGWKTVKRIFRIFKTIRISVILVFLCYILFFQVDQVTDAVIAFGNFGTFHKYIFFTCFALIWAFLTWYWSGVFFYLEYSEEETASYEKFLISHLPHWLGTLALLIPALAFITAAAKMSADEGRSAMLGTGLLFIGVATAFLIVVYVYQRRQDLKRLPKPEKGARDFLKLRDLPSLTRKILFISTITVTVIFLLITIFPYTLTGVTGNSISVLFACLSAWLVGFYWLAYLGRNIKLPVFLLLGIWILFCGIFNGNKNIMFIEDNREFRDTYRANAVEMTRNFIKNAKEHLNQSSVNNDGLIKHIEKYQREADLFYKTKGRLALRDYFDFWYEGQKEKWRGKRVPLILVLSEGGGIRAAFWSSGVLCRLNQEVPELNSYIFGIQGVSGGAFGAAVYAGLLKNQQISDSDMQELAAKVVGGDYLTPVFASMFTRGIIQAMIPFPIQAMDHARVFEKYWEIRWQKHVPGEMKNRTFSYSFGSLWNDGSYLKIPPLFLNTTKVEDGTPVTISPLAFGDPNISPPLGLTQDFYNFSEKQDIKLVTAASLSARFPYIGPAGTMKLKNREMIGLVDGGYFDNTGANLAHDILMDVKFHLEERENRDHSDHSFFRDNILPIVVYLKNGSQITDVYSKSDTVLYQMAAVPRTLLQVRDSCSRNSLCELQEFIKMYNGKFLEFSLEDTNSTHTSKCPAVPATPIPLGWSLSKQTQKLISCKILNLEVEKVTQLENALDPTQDQDS